MACSIHKRLKVGPNRPSSLNNIIILKMLVTIPLTQAFNCRIGVHGHHAVLESFIISNWNPLGHYLYPFPWSHFNQKQFILHRLVKGKLYKALSFFLDLLGYATYVRILLALS